VADVIDGVTLSPLRVIADDRGAVLHMLRGDALGPIREVYFSEINPGTVKAWKRHRRMTQRLAVPVGRAKFALCDTRPGSSSRGRVVEIELGRPDAYQLLTIPPGVWYGWKNLSASVSMIANCADLVHDPAESEQADTIPEMAAYRW
jgi:dTDP-4-dehydrorhamnose 3,5-epimerase